jgi:hypothetical protein
MFSKYIQDDCKTPSDEMYVESTVFLVVRSYSSEIAQPFGEKYSLQLQGGRVPKQETSRSWQQAGLGILKMEAICMKHILLPASG